MLMLMIVNSKKKKKKKTIYNDKTTLFISSHKYLFIYFLNIIKI